MLNFKQKYHAHSERKIQFNIHKKANIYYKALCFYIDKFSIYDIISLALLKPQMNDLSATVFYKIFF